ncbi:MAG TPA: 4-alpha-glucanotransferase [Stellaceae bacterium]|nr:4-alpha-glucanotransferase [Stellaceae bacterium]
MSDDSLLVNLAALAGIETRYRDAWGGEKVVRREAIEALLACLGLRVDSAGRAAALMRELAAQRWRQLCDPVLVLPAERPVAEIPLYLPLDRESLEWRLTDEAGAVREGRAFGEDMPQRDDGAAAEHGVAVRLLRLEKLAAGYFSLVLRCGGRECSATIIVAPAQCYLPAELDHNRRAWALTTQLYALRSRRNWGIGDFSDLAELSSGIARHGARAVGVNPLHALFAAEPRHISPYSPSSRLFLNDLYIDVEAVPEFAACEPARAFAALPDTERQLAAARDSDLVDHAAVAALKRAAFEHLYRCFRDRHLGAGRAAALSERGRAFRAFQQAGGEALRRFAVFEALHELYIASGVGFAWRQWELPMQDPASAEVAEFAAAEYERIEYFQYLQWEADRQLGEAARRGRDAGLAIGLYRDLAVGVDPHGAEAWADQELLVPDASVGAPPDLLNFKGQNWGLAPINPLVLRARAYAPFIACLRANMRHAGALRIDHVMALQRLYWVPGGMAPSEGAYIAYPIDDLLRIVALESHRQRCAVIGEDLGTVPEGFRERLRAANVLSYRVLIFERQADGSFVPPDQYPELATASVATHDVATLRGYWTGRDLKWRRELDLYSNAGQRAEAEASRARERRLLLDALVREGVLPPDAAKSLLGDEAHPVFAPALSEAVHRFLGRSNARLVLVQIEDALGELDQANLPGTFDEHPNWRRKLSLAVSELLGDPALAQLAAALNEARQLRRAAPPR